jgi:uncharacterized membrane protein
MVKFKVEEGETEQITYGGKRVRRKTVLLRVGQYSISQKALLLGLMLAICQVFDGFLTYIGLSIMGVQMEGNTFLRTLMEAYGKAPVLFASKLIAIFLIGILTFEANRRRWVRPFIVLLILIYLGLAVFPWTYIISKSLTAA